MVLDSILDPVLGWVLALPLWLGILILAAILTMITNLVYKYTTDQKEMKRLKEKIKSTQEEMKKHRQDPKKLQKIQKEAMETNMSYTMKSLKPMLYTFLPLILIFGWMNANLAYELVQPGEMVPVHVQMQMPSELTLTGDVLIDGEATKQTIESQANWKISADSLGEHPFTITDQDGNAMQHFLLVGDRPQEFTKAGEAPFEQLELSYQKNKPFGGFSLFGYQPGWLFTYILFSIVLSISTRKLMKIY